ncbi:DUF7455 domain-containing protein [Pseudonocardia hispaniensis]
MDSPSPTRLDRRCDRCGAAATVRVILSTGHDLLFCGHHAREHRPALEAAGARLSTQA